MKSLMTEIMPCAVSELIKNASALKTRPIKKTTMNIPNHFRLLRKVVSLDRMALRSIAGDPDTKGARGATQNGRIKMPDGGLPVKMFPKFSRIVKNVAKAMIAQINNRSVFQ